MYLNGYTLKYTGQYINMFNNFQFVNNIYTIAVQNNIFKSTAKNQRLRSEPL